ncbi:MAG: DUF4197 domain-containing protein [Deltaproteobacteria bacterium]|nr:DUF4197 domain-containing protein [Deltaproteobacteria bacterium]
MKRISRLGLVVFLGVLMICSGCVTTGGQGKSGSGSLSDGDIISGLKEALIVGTINAVLKVSKLDGYFGNDKISIPLPESIRKYEDPLRKLGLGTQIDQFKTSMNRAAEKAAPQAKEIFVNAAKQMSFTDARKILFGKENEATLYFKEKTSDTLTSMFKPIVHQTMAEVGVTKYYQLLSPQLTLLSLGQSAPPDLDSYVTKLAVDGLFVMVGEEEKNIRNNPTARVTDILKKVFGGSGS